MTNERQVAELDDALIARYLLQQPLTPDEQERLERELDRPEGYESVAAYEDHLLLAFHRGKLPPETHARVEEIYSATRSRRARLDEAAALIDAARSWEGSHGSWWSRVVLWLVGPVEVPRLVAVSGVLAVATLATVSAVLVLRSDPAGDVAVTLTSTGTRSAGQGAGASTMDRVVLPVDARVVELTFAIDDPGDETVTGTLAASDRAMRIALGPPRLDRAATETYATWSVDARSLIPGDYEVRAETPGRQVPLGARAFRVVRRGR